MSRGPFDDMKERGCTLYTVPDEPCYCTACAKWDRLAVKSLAALFLIVLAAILLFGCASAPPNPKPSGGDIFWDLDLQIISADGIAVQGVIVIKDGPNQGEYGLTDAVGHKLLRHLQQSGFTICAVAPDYEIACGGITLISSQNLTFKLSKKEPPRPAVQPLQASGRIFRTQDGQPWRWRGVSAFALLDRFAKGQDISDTLNAYKGYNVLRVWPYVPAKDWGAKAWDVQSADVTRKFLAAMAAKGWYVELTLLTDDDPARLAWAKAFLPQLVAGGCPANLLVELGNEPTTHKSINTAALRAAADASGCLYASGNYEDSAKAFGSYLVTHTTRDNEWPRRSHDCLDFYNGGGPNLPSDPPHHVPCVLDEPAKAQDVAQNADDWRGYFGAGSLMAAGATFHSETGKFGLPPTPAEAVLAAAALEALNAFPADAPLGAYSRPVENSLRTYAIGPYMVRVRPTSPTPGAGWQRIGQSLVLWKR